MASFLGIVVVWFSDGIVHRSILEFIRFVTVSLKHAKIILFLITSRLTQKHDGIYLAEVTANCLKRFGLDKLVGGYLLFHFSSKINYAVASFNMYG